ncbi:hypothetical protein Gorai_007567 [Gossypium raimondii]|uniref:Uncharacterized protein n=1 Tax=Gossypium raimondii TaxID=29730 RepID=A0A7J8Q8A5_GOSRA|nr:hypothetical protein [Gossypium raimondii]
MEKELEKLSLEEEDDEGIQFVMETRP